MPHISFLKGRTPVEVSTDDNLMHALQDAEIPVASSCGGEGICAKCRLKIVAGAENLSTESTAEKDLREHHGIPAGERISCQTLVLGDVTVDATYW